MSKLKAVTLSLVVVAALSYLLRDQIADAYLDQKASSMVGKCYGLKDTRNESVVGTLNILEYNSESNELNVEGVLDMGIMYVPFKGTIPRDGFIEGQESGEVIDWHCEGEEE